MLLVLEYSAPLILQIPGGAAVTEHPARSGAGVCGERSNSVWELRAPERS